MNQNMDSYQESEKTKNSSTKPSTSQQRQVACIVNIAELLEGRYVKEGGWSPNYILTKNNQRVSRVNLLGVIVNIGDDQTLPYTSVILDDGSGKISIRDFEKSPILKTIKIGEIVKIIGKSREYFGEKYVIPEIVKTTDDKKWIEVRKLQHKLNQLENPPTEIKATEPESELPDDIEYRNKSNSTEETIQTESIQSIEDIEEIKDEEEPQISQMETKNETKSKTPADEIIDCIQKLDQGDGADIEEVLKDFPDKNGEKIITNLLKEGEIFETKPGKIKVLN